MAWTMTSSAELLGNRRRVLVTGGAGFIGGSVIRRLLRESEATIFNLDKMGYASDLTSIEEVLAELGETNCYRHRLQRVDLKNAEAVEAAVREADPDLVMHLAAESHVDRSISGPGEFIASNITGTYNLLQAVRKHYDQLSNERSAAFRLHHISTDEVFGSLGSEGHFSESTPYDPRSPYSATKAASDHLVLAWHHTFAPGSTDQLLQQLRPLAVSRKTDPVGHPESNLWRGHSSLRRWTQCARLAVRGRSRRRLITCCLPRPIRTQLLRWWIWRENQQRDGGSHLPPFGSLSTKKCCSRRSDHPGRRPTRP